MKENKEMTEQELGEISGGPHYSDWSRVKAGFMQYTDGFDKNGSGYTFKKPSTRYLASSKTSE